MKNFLTVITWAGAILLYLLPLTGCVISFVYQVQIQQATLGFFTTHVHIWNIHDLWDLTILLYIPILLFSFKDVIFNR